MNAKHRGVPFGIIDLSLAPTPAVGDSVAHILEASVWVPLADGRNGITHVKTKLPLPLARALCRIQLHYQSVPGRALIKNFTAYDALTHLRVKLTDNTLSSWTEAVKDAVFDRDPPYVFPAFRLYLFLLLNIVLLALPGAILLVILQWCKYSVQSASYSK